MSEICSGARFGRQADLQPTGHWSPHLQQDGLINFTLEIQSNFKPVGDCSLPNRIGGHNQKDLFNPFQQSKI